MRVAWPWLEGLWLLTCCKSWSKTLRRRSRVPGRNKQQRKLLSSILKKENTYVKKKKTTLEDRCSRGRSLCRWPSYGHEIGSATAARGRSERTDCRSAAAAGRATAAGTTSSTASLPATGTTSTTGCRTSAVWHDF